MARPTGPAIIGEAAKSFLARANAHHIQDISN
jgi:hypothetical protein